MGYSSEVLSRASTRLAGLRADHESKANARRAQAYRQVPRIQAIDKQMQQNMVSAAFAAFSGGAQDAMEQAKQRNRALEQERAELLAKHFAPGFLDDAPFCGVCGGSGYIGTTMCDCLKKLCAEEQRKELGAIFARGECFENFRLDYYSDTVVPQLGAAPRTFMKKILKACRDYARSFGPHSGNLLLNGSTGLGKTHLALSIGRVVGDMGCSVCYETASSLFSKLEQAKFSTTAENFKEAKRLEECDLLIIDDLGTEMTTQFTQSVLYQVINTRMMEDKPVIISTNLTTEALSHRYSGPIASRLLGAYQLCPFLGRDIRQLRR